MTENHKPVKAVKYVEEETQLDRIEKKVDRLLNILENGELSVSIDGKELSNNLSKELSRVNRLARR